jgi:uncharacterized protein (TIGR02391 family)
MTGGILLDKLVMTFEPNTIEHLGIKMYSRLPTALAELIANAYDACSPNVAVKLYDDEGDRRVIVEDNGLGMTFDDINLFLRIGRNRRTEGGVDTPCGRTPTGKKGLGKLALFGLGDTIKIITKRNGQKVKFTLDWNEIMGTEGNDYEPTFNIEEGDEDDTGTTIILTNLKRKTDFDVEGLSISLSKLFNFPDKDFKILLSINDEDPIIIDSKLKYENIESEFEWKFPSFSENIDFDFEHKDDVKGRIITTEKPLEPGLRGITLFANGRMVNQPEFFGISESSHFFSYTTGWIDVDYIDNLDKDVISTNRQSIDWEYDETRDLKLFLQEIVKTIHYNWREERKDKRKKKIHDKTKINLDEWYSKLPTEINEKIKPLITSVIEESELPEKSQNEVVESIHDLIPEYPYYHWRHLHNEIRNASKRDYERADYYRAFQEAVKRYITMVRNKSGSENSSDASMMGEVFGKGNTLTVIEPYTKPDGSDFQDSTKDNIENGQKFLSMGIVAGCRNPVSHEEIYDLLESNLFTEKDCLDALSILSHIFRLLDDAERR